MSSQNASSSKAIALGVAALLMGGLPAFAEAPPEAPPEAPKAQAVAYADLDLSRPADAKALMTRIEIAAKDACGGHPNYSPAFPRARNEFAACTDEAVAVAVASVNHPALTALLAPGANQSPVGALAAR